MQLDILARTHVRILGKSFVAGCGASPVEHRVRAGDHPVGALPLLVGGHAEARRDQLDRLPGRAPRRPRSSRCTTRSASSSARAREHDRELVATEPVGVVAARARLRSASASSFSARSPASWPSVSFTRFKLSMSHRTTANYRVRPGHLAPEPRAEGAPVEEPGERIVGRLVAQLQRLVGGLQRGHRLVREQPQRLEARRGWEAAGRAARPPRSARAGGPAARRAARSASDETRRSGRGRRARSRARRLPPSRSSATSVGTR